jgi:hypothetical protein
LAARHGHKGHCIRRIQDGRRNVESERTMILDQGKLANGLVDELLALIHKYDESLYMCSVIGVLELVKQQLITESLNMEDDE